MYKIVLFNNALSGGAGKFITTLAKALHKTGSETHIIIFQEKIDFDIPEGVHFHLLTREDGSPLKSKKEIVHALKKELESIGNIDLIVSNSSPSNQLLSQLDLPNTFHVVHSAETKHYSGFFAPLKQWWRKRTYRKLYSNKHIITVSKGLQSYILEKLKAKPLFIETIYNPFDFEEIRQKAEEITKEIPKEPYIINVARFNINQKRQDILLKAYKLSNIPYKLVLLGQGEDEGKIRELIKELHLEEKVLLPGFSKNPYAWIKQAKLFVLSSDFEGYPRTLVEAAIIGTSIVSTDCPTGPNELLKNELEKYLVPTGNSQLLAEKISQALIQYPIIKDIDLIQFNNDIIAKKYIDLIENHL